MRRVRIAALLAAALSATHGGAAAGAPAAPSGGGAEGAADSLRIASIRIETHDVYAGDETVGAFLPRLANRLHVRTRPSTVRKFLLFREGETAHPEALAQAERNLRRQLFLRDARVRSRGNGDGSTDVVVTTRDAWTTTPRVGYSREGGEAAFALSATERNLLGTGRKLKLAYEEDAVRIRRLLEFIDPHLLGPYRSGSALLAQNSDGHERYLAIARPFAATTDRRAAGGWFTDLAREDRLYADGMETTRFRHERREITLDAAFAPLAGPLRAGRVGGGITWSRDRFDSLAAGTRSDLPADREFALLTVRGEWVRSRAVTVNHVNRDARFEDFELGPRAALLAGISPEFLGVAATTGRISASASAGTGSAAEDGRGRAAILTAAGSTRLGAPRANASLSLDVLCFARLASAPPQTLVGRVEVVRGWDLDEEVQFLADGSTGLRAFPLFAYAGSRRVLANLEHRLALGRELFRAVAPGVAIFADAGAAVPEGRPFTFDDVKADVGLGLRLAFPRAAEHDLVRIDAAWPLSPDPAGRRGIVVSVSSRPAF